MKDQKIYENPYRYLDEESESGYLVKKPTEKMVEDNHLKTVIKKDQSEW